MALNGLCVCSFVYLVLKNVPQNAYCSSVSLAQRIDFPFNVVLTESFRDSLP